MKKVSITLVILSMMLMIGCTARDDLIITVEDAIKYEESLKKLDDSKVSGISEEENEELDEVNEELDKENEELNKDNDTSIKEVIAATHKYMNDKLCWEKESNIAFDDYAYLANSVESVIGQANSESVKDDLSIAVKLLRKGAKDKERKYLLYAHRILHDLDAHYFHEQDKDFFAVTKTLNGKNAYVKIVE